jgi:hypothetical protein
MSATLTFAPFAPGTGVAVTAGVGLPGTAVLSGVRSTSHPTPSSARAKPDIKTISFRMRIAPPLMVIWTVKIFSVSFLTRIFTDLLQQCSTEAPTCVRKSALNRRLISPANQSIPYSEICKAHALMENHRAAVVDMFNKHEARRRRNMANYLSDH